VKEIAEELQLRNVIPLNQRFEQIGETFDFITGRAVQSLPEFFRITHPKLSRINRNSITNGILYLTGGDTLSLERSFEKRLTIWDIDTFFPDSYFRTKKIIHLPKP